MCGGLDDLTNALPQAGELAVTGGGGEGLLKQKETAGTQDEALSSNLKALARRADQEERSFAKACEETALPGRGRMDQQRGRSGGSGGELRVVQANRAFKTQVRQKEQPGTLWLEAILQTILESGHVP